MNEAKEKFIQKFKEISNKGWIKSNEKSFIAVGTTFEKELGKKADSLFLPDYEGIEIKCSQRYSMYPLNLFSKSLDGPFLFSTNEFLEKYGKENPKYNKKELIIELNANDYTQKNTTKYKLEINKKEEKIYIETVDISNTKEKQFYVEFKSIEEIINIKLKNLAFIKASMKKINNNKYFRYYSLNLLKIKSFDKFIELLEKGIINCTFIGRVSKTNYTPGKNKNKGLHFSINKENINQLFDEEYSYTSDKKTNQED